MWELQLVLSVFGFLCLMFLSVLVMILYEKVKTYESFILRLFKFIQTRRFIYAVSCKKNNNLFNREKKNWIKLMKFSYRVISELSLLHLLNLLSRYFTDERPILKIVKGIIEEGNSCEFKDIKKGEKENEKAK